MDDLVTESLMTVADRAGDITPLIYRKYFDASPESEALMSHIDDLARGKMMAEVFRLVMLDDLSVEKEYLSWEVDNHELAYSVEPYMYEPLFQAMVETVREVMGNDWSDALEAAWQARTDMLRSELVSRFRSGSSVNS